MKEERWDILLTCILSFVHFTGTERMTDRHTSYVPITVKATIRPFFTPYKVPVYKGPL